MYFYHLSGLYIAAKLNQSTPQHRTRNPTALVYLIFQPIRSTAVIVAHNTGRLLPCLFTLSSINIHLLRWLFSVTLLFSHENLPVRKYGSLRCPDFPLLLKSTKAIEQSAVIFVITN